MRRTIRGNGARVNVIVGPMVMVIGVVTALSAVVLSVALGSAWFLCMLIPAALALGGGLLILWTSRRSRLTIDDHGFTWCGAFGAPSSLAWEQVHQLLPPPAGDPRLVLIVQLRDGTRVPVRAMWAPPTSPSSLLGSADHSAAQNALLAAHRHWLAAHR